MPSVKSIDGIVNGLKFIPDMPSLMGLFEGKRVELKRIVKKRSNPENKYYWGVLLPIAADELGVTEKEAHENFILEHLSSVEEIIKNGKTFYFTKVKRTKDLNTEEFQGYLSRCRDTILYFCGVVIPLPNEAPLY